MAEGSEWTPHKIAVWQHWSWGRYLAFKTNFYGPWHLSDDNGQTAIFTDDSLQEVMQRAQEIEARKCDAALLADICDNMAEVLKPLPGIPDAPGQHAGTRAIEPSDGAGK